MRQHLSATTSETGKSLYNLFQCTNCNVSHLAMSGQHCVAAGQTSLNVSYNPILTEKYYLSVFWLPLPRQRGNAQVNLRNSKTVNESFMSPFTFHRLSCSYVQSQLSIRVTRVTKTTVMTGWSDTGLSNNKNTLGSQYICKTSNHVKILTN